MLYQPHYVVLHVHPGPLPNSPPDLAPIAQSGRFDLTDDIWLERLSLGLGTLIINACSPRNNRIEPLDKAEHLYAFIRRVPDNEKHKFEGIELLRTVITLSRVVQATSIGLRYCAWVSSLTSDDPIIKAIPFMGICPDVMLAPNTRDWLSEADGAEMRRLVPWLTNDMHKRVFRAWWNLEYLMHVAELDMRWLYVVSGLEALMNTDREASTSQFRHRVYQLGSALGIKLSKTDLTHAYDIRSKLSHTHDFLQGLHAAVPAIKQDPLYQKLETLLRVTVRRCLLDATFGDRFKDEGSVDASWPMPV